MHVPRRSRNRPANLFGDVRRVGTGARACLRRARIAWRHQCAEPVRQPRKGQKEQFEPRYKKTDRSFREKRASPRSDLHRSME